MWRNSICPTARKERGELQGQECLSAVWSSFLKSSSVKGMGSIASTVLYSDIHRITRSVFPSSERSLYRKRKCLKGGKSVTASSALTVIMYVPSSEARKPSPSSVYPHWMPWTRGVRWTICRLSVYYWPSHRTSLVQGIQWGYTLEGSFGTQKPHYSLARIKARNKKTEILWIFFGIHTANVILMINKIRNRTGKAAWYEFTGRIRRGHQTSSGASCLAR